MTPEQLKIVSSHLTTTEKLIALLVVGGHTDPMDVAAILGKGYSTIRNPWKMVQSYLKSQTEILENHTEIPENHTEIPENQSEKPDPRARVPSLEKDNNKLLSKKDEVSPSPKKTSRKKSEGFIPTDDWVASDEDLAKLVSEFRMTWKDAKRLSAELRDWAMENDVIIKSPIARLRKFARGAKPEAFQERDEKLPLAEVYARKTGFKPVSEPEELQLGYATPDYF